MLLSLHAPDQIGIRACRPDSVLLTSGETLRESFLLSPETGVHAWQVIDARTLGTNDLTAVIAARPDVFLLGTGERQVFPSAAVMAACLSQRIGIEVMDNAAAARTFNVLGSEGRKVLLGMLLPVPTA